MTVTQHMVLKSQSPAAVESMEGLQWQHRQEDRRQGRLHMAVGSCDAADHMVQLGTKMAAWPGCECQAGSIML